MPSLSPAYPAFSLLSCPLSPQPPSPAGKGETLDYFMQGAPPLASPRLNPGGTGSTCRCRRLNGGVPPALLARRALAVPGGGLPSLSPADHAFSLLSCPLFPRPPSPAGKGEIFCFLMQGASPLASPGLNLRFAAKPTEFLYLERCRQPRRGGTGGEELRRLRWSSPPGQIEQVPRGLAFLVACLPCLQCIFLPPIPPPPFPGGEGGDQGYFMQGASPLASPGLNPGGTGAGGVSRAGGGVPSESPTRRKTDRTAFLLAVPAAKERGDRGRWNYPSHATAAFEMVLSPGAGRASAAGACLSCRLSTLTLALLLPPIPPAPFPGGEGGDSKFISPGAPPPAPRH